MRFDSETSEKKSLASRYKWLHYLQSDQTGGFIAQPNRRSDGVLTLAGDSRAEERGKEEGGGGIRGSLSLSLTEQQHKSDIVASTKNLTSCPIRSRVLHGLLSSQK